MERSRGTQLEDVQPPSPPSQAPVPTDSLGATASDNPRKEATAGRLAFTDFGPHSIALIPFSLAIGSASALNGLSLAETLFAAGFLLAGAAQLAATELIGEGTDVVVIVATITLINLRFMIYGAGLAQWFSEASMRQRLLLAVPLVDQSFLSCEARFATMTSLSERRRYYATGSMMLVSAFALSQTVGYLAGPSVPEGLGLHLAAPLAFAGMLAKSIQGKPQLVAATAAAVTLVLGAGLPGGLGLPIAIVAGLVASSRTQGANSQ